MTSPGELFLNGYIRSKLLNYFQNKNISFRLSISGFVCLIMFSSGCTQLQVKEGVFSPSHKEYTLNMPGGNWTLFKVGKEDFALWNKQSNAMIALITSNFENKKISLEMLNNQLFIGMKNKEVIFKEPIKIDNKEAIHTSITCEMDNYKFKIDSYVVKAKNRVYDLVYWSPCDSFDLALGDFVDMIKSFKFLQLSESIQ